MDLVTLILQTSVFATRGSEAEEGFVPINFIWEQITGLNLVEALRKKEIAGAALDVFEGEPHPTLPEDFVAMKNVVLTPHFGSAVAEKREIMSNTVVDMILDFMDGKRPVTLFNPEIYEFISLHKEGFLESNGGYTPLLLKNSDNPGQIFLSSIIKNPDETTTLNGEGLIASFIFKWIGDKAEPVSIKNIELIDHNCKINSINPVNLDSPVPLPVNYVLKQNYPNPFNNETIIKYELPEASIVTINIFNTLGQKIKTLLNTKKKPGWHLSKWDGTNDLGFIAASGLYIYTIKAESFIKARKMVLLK